MTRHQPEHALQVRINVWVRQYVAQPHFFFSVDRSQAASRFTHAREKARGLVAGTPDTVLLAPNLPAIAVELKASGNRPSEAQEMVRDKIIAAGHVWGWTNSVRGYAAILGDNGVVLREGWMFAAERADAVLQGAAIKRKQVKPARVPRSPQKWGDPGVVPPTLDEVLASL